jgi:branched-chain amino acid transport system permease protein
VETRAIRDFRGGDAPGVRALIFLRVFLVPTDLTVRLKNFRLLALALMTVGSAVATTALVENEYFYFSTYLILQYIILATAWNILGGYTGYVNFGTAAFFGIGAYASAYLINTYQLGFPFLLLAGGLPSAALGMGIGYLTLRLKGVYFAIATLALSVVIATLILNTPAFGGARGIFVLRPREVALFGSYMEFLFVAMVVLAVLAVGLAWYIEHSWIGSGLAAIRDDEEAAACTGVPVLKLKVFAAAASGFLMGVAGAPYPYYISYLEPMATISLDVAVNSLAMPMIGGTTSWIGPVLGAVVLGSAQQIATVTISSEYNLLIVGVLLVLFVIVAPNGLLGLFQGLWRGRSAR